MCQLGQHRLLIKFSYLLICLLIFSTGCKTISTYTTSSALEKEAVKMDKSRKDYYDYFPENVPKGYVEFYNSKDGDSELCQIWFVRKYDNGFEIDRPRKFTEMTSIHTYVVHLGQESEKITLEVFEGKVTPVEVTIITLNKKYHFWGRKTTFQHEIRLNVESSIPYKK